MRLEGGYQEKRYSGYDVSIPYWCDWKVDTAFEQTELITSFNSLLVRLEASSTDQVASLQTSFNSLLVRLEVYVILPSWTRFKFQFLIGAIGSWNLEHWLLPNICFNSLLVRLEVRTSRSCYTDVRVSIPYWCDWKEQMHVQGIRT